MYELKHFTKRQHLPVDSLGTDSVYLGCYNSMGGWGGLIHVDIREIMLVFKTVMNFNVFNLLGVYCHLIKLK